MQAALERLMTYFELQEMSVSDEARIEEARRDERESLEAVKERALTR